MGKYDFDDDPQDLRDRETKNYKSGFWRGGTDPPEVFKPMLRVDIKTGRTLLNELDSVVRW